MPDALRGAHGHSKRAVHATTIARDVARAPRIFASIAVDGVPVTTLGLDGAVARILGVAHTTLAVTLKRGEQAVPLVVERLPFRM